MPFSFYCIFISIVNGRVFIYFFKLYVRDLQDCNGLKCLYVPLKIVNKSFYVLVIFFMISSNLYK